MTQEYTVSLAHVDPATAFILAGVVGGSVIRYVVASVVATWKRWRGQPVSVVLDARDNALLVIAQTPHIRHYLSVCDPQALAQVEAALEQVTGSQDVMRQVDALRDHEAVFVSSTNR
jgi:hypothetical protein